MWNVLETSVTSDSNMLWKVIRNETNERPACIYSYLQHLISTVINW